MIKRFCSLCMVEINNFEVYYDVMITPKKGLNDREEGNNYYDDFCFGCTNNGKALVYLMSKRNKDFKNKDKEKSK